MVLRFVKRALVIFMMVVVLRTQLEYIGVWNTTAYTWTGNPCANGNYPTEGYTIAHNSLPFGTKVYIADVGYRTVQDRGPEYLGGEWCDIYMDSYDACVQWGMQGKDVYLVKEEEISFQSILENFEREEMF